MAADIEPTYPLTILVEIEEESEISLADLQATVDEVLVEDAHGRRWVVRRFFERNDVIPTSEGFYEVQGHIPVSPSYPVRALGFQLAAALTERLVGPLTGTAMPDFPSTAFGPVEIVEAEDQPPSVVGSARGSDVLEPTWPLLAMRCDEAWDLVPPRPEGRTRGEGVVIGHPDSGYTFHQELLPSLDLQRDFDVIDSDTNAEDPMKKRWWWPFDSPGHGTSTGSVIVSTEASVVTGAAPAATLVPMRAIRSVVQVSDGDVARAIDRAVTAGAHVISMSLGGVGFYSGIRAALGRARTAGVIVMAAAGNKVQIVVAPARFDECIAVAATDSSNQPWEGSSRGNQVLISAPGHEVPVARAEKGSTPGAPGLGSGVSSGTSYSVAHLAGVAALWLAFHDRAFLLDRYGPSGLQMAFEEILSTVGFQRPDPWDDAWGVGVVDAVEVLTAPLPAPAAPTPTVFGSTEAAAAVPRPVDRLIELGATDPDDPRRGLCEVLRCGDDELDEVVRVHGPELAYAFAEAEPIVDREVDSDAASAGLTATAMVPPEPIRRTLGNTAALSPKLRARLGGDAG